MKILPLILCGGAGTRLWPLSREQYPKQLLPLLGDLSLLQSTAKRCLPYSAAEAPMLVCNEEHRFLVAEQMRHIGLAPSAIVLEPVAKNTAPAVALGAELATMTYEGAGEDALLVVQPSDHLIPDSGAFLAALDEALALARQGHLVTFGVTPVKPETGYGYIHAGSAIPGSKGLQVDRFVEKPDAKTAQAYLASGEHFWNSGIFVFKASRYLEELTACRPDIAKAVKAAVAKQHQDMDFTRIDAAAFSACPAESIDYAVMEPTQSAAMVPLQAGWSDLGAWDAIWEASPRDSQGNAIEGDVIAQNVTDSYLHAEHRLVSVAGVSNLVVVETADAVLIASKDEAQQVKGIVASLKACGREERATHRKVYRPWGCYEGIDAGAGFQVKRITVSPGGSLSLQRHAKRAEHWVVVRGTATVTRDDDVFDLKENEYVHIPLGSKHRLQNRTDQQVEIIEVQLGSYLGEDDIERFDDVYGRSGS